MGGEASKQQQQNKIVAGFQRNEKPKNEDSCVVRNCDFQKREGNSLYCDACFQRLEDNKNIVEGNPEAVFGGRCINQFCKHSVINFKNQKAVKASGAPPSFFCSAACRHNGDCESEHCLPAVTADDYWRAKKTTFLCRIKGKKGSSKMREAMGVWHILTLTSSYLTPP